MKLGIYCISIGFSFLLKGMELTDIVACQALYSHNTHDFEYVSVLKQRGREFIREYTYACHAGQIGLKLELYSKIRDLTALLELSTKLATTGYAQDPYKAYAEDTPALRKLKRRRATILTTLTGAMPAGSVEEIDKLTARRDHLETAILSFLVCSLARD